MDEGIVQQILGELLSSLEPLETQSAALLQFLKAKGIATDEELAPFLEQAGNTSSIRWRAVRVRTAALISSAMKPTEQPVEPIATQNKQSPHESAAEPDQEKPQKETAPKEEIQKKETWKKETEPVLKAAQKGGDNASNKPAPRTQETDNDKKESKSSKSDAAPEEAPKQAA